MTYRVDLAASAIRDLDHIPARVVPAIVEFLFGPLAAEPWRVGKRLRNPFESCLGARRGDYRVLYEVDEHDRSVTVTRIAHRSQSYRPS